MSDCIVDDNAAVYRRVLELQTHICRVVRAPSVVLHMRGLISAADVTDIKSIDERHPEGATFVMTMKIIKSSQPGKWKAFIDALHNADYPYVASLLTCGSKDLTQYQHNKKILQIFAPYLELQLEPFDIITHLGAVGVLNIADLEEIKACLTNRGSVAATMLMLDRLQRREEPSVWYMNFLKILYQKGHVEIVQEMEPEFTVDCEVLKVPNICFTDGAASDAECNDQLENMIEAKVMHFKSELVVLLKLEKIAPALCRLLDIEKVYQLSRITSQKESIDSMFEEVRRLKDITKWRTFIKCLRISDYSYLADVLSRPSVWKLQCKEREVLRLFLPEIGEQLDPVELVSHLEQEHVINQTDKREILATNHQFGCSAASFVLIDCLQCRAPPYVWFRTFKKTLVKLGREDLVEIIDPDFQTSDEEPVQDFEKEPIFRKLISRRDEVLSQIYKSEKAAMEKLDSIQNHFEHLKNKLKEDIDNMKYETAKLLQNADEMIEEISPNSNAVNENVAKKIEETLNNFISTKYILRPEEKFMNLNRVGVLFKRRHALQKQNSFDNFQKFSWADKKGHKNLIHQVSVLHEQPYSTSSSSNSQSSGFLQVETSLSKSYLLSSNELNADSISLQDRVQTLRESEQSSDSSIVGASSDQSCIDPSIGHTCSCIAIEKVAKIDHANMRNELPGNVREPEKLIEENVYIPLTGFIDARSASTDIALSTNDKHLPIKNSSSSDVNSLPLSTENTSLHNFPPSSLRHRGVGKESETLDCNVVENCQQIQSGGGVNIFLGDNRPSIAVASIIETKDVANETHEENISSCYELEHIDNSRNTEQTSCYEEIIDDSSNVLMVIDGIGEMSLTFENTVEAISENGEI